MRERLQLYMIACIFHDDVVAILLHSHEIKKIDALLPCSVGRSEICTYVRGTSSFLEAEDRESRFPLFFSHGEVGLRERDEFCKPSERREKGGPKMRGFSAVSGRPR